MASIRTARNERNDATRLLSWLADPVNRRMLAESWWWRRYGAATETERRLAVVNLVDHRVAGAALRWPGDIGRPPSAESQIVILAAAWLRGLVELPGLESPEIRWTEAEIAAFAESQIGAGLPWFAISEEAALHTILARTKTRVYGGKFVIVPPVEPLSQLADALSTPPVTQISI